MKVTKLENQPYQSFRDVMFGNDPAKVETMVKNPLREFSRVTQDIKVAADTAKANIPMLGKIAYAFFAYREVNPTDATYYGMGKTESLATFLAVPDKKNGLNRILPIVNAFRLVDAQKLTETVFDSVKADTLVATGEIVKLVNSQLDHPAIADTIAILNGTSESKAKEIRALKSRIQVDDKGVVTGYLSASEAKAKDDAEKAESEKSGGFNLADEADCNAMAGTIANANMGAVLAAILAIARTTTDTAQVETLANFAGGLMGVLSARFDKASILAAVRDSAQGEEAASNAVKAGAEAGLPAGLKLIK